MIKDRYSVIAIILVATVVVYGLLWPVIAPDVKTYLKPWLDQLIVEGPIGAFAEPFSNYTPPYLYLLSIGSLFHDLLPALTLIKAVSLFTALLLAGSIYRLLRVMGVERPVEAALWSLLLPSVVMNVPLLAQCDPLWTAPCIMATVAGIKGRNVEMLVWAGLAFAIKAHAAFIAPFVFLILLRSRSPFYLWLIPPGAYILAMLPAWLVGWPAMDLATVYLRQAQWNPTFMSSAANPWMFIHVFAPNTGWHYAWAGYLATLMGTGLYLWKLHNRALTPRALLVAATLSATLVPFLLPKMHERYFMLADALSFALAFVFMSQRTNVIAILINAASTFALGAYILQTPVLALMGAVMVAAAIAMLVAELLTERKLEPETPEILPLGSDSPIKVAL